jgi:hypothetical protein
MAFKNWDMELTESNLKEEIAKAKAAGKKAASEEPRAESVYYDESKDLIVIQLKMVLFSVLLQNLYKA